MRQIIIRKTGGPSALLWESARDPIAEAGNLRIAVQAIGINFADILVRQGLYQDVPHYPIVPGYEVAGIVDQIGAGVDASWLGKEVFALTFFGGYAEKVCVPLAHVFEKPKSMSFEVACGLPTTYATAYQMLVVMGALKARERILIHNVGGGVGLAALDIAQHLGAEVYGTASPGKHQTLRERGLLHSIDYRSQDWEAEFSRMTQGQGAHLILDPLGGHNFRKSYRSLAISGRLGMFGISEASHSGIVGKFRLLKNVLTMPFFHPASLMNENKAVFGVNLARLVKQPQVLRSWVDVIVDWAERGLIKPTIDRSFEFEAAAEAHSYIEQRRNFGKVVLKVSAP